MSKFIAKPFSLFIILMFAFAALSVSCSLTKGKEQAGRAVEKFHGQFNAAQYSEIYQQGDDKFKEAVTEAEFTELLEAVRRKLGTVGNANQAGWRVNATTMGTVVVVGYETQFSEGKGSEQFSFLINGEQANLLRYDINSPLLITR
jgi:Protein of unknown function (DUF3887)/Protein of unknown function (DUF4019)